METASISETAKTDSQTRLVMCEELRKLHKIDSIIPQPLLKVYAYMFITFILIPVIKMYFCHTLEKGQPMQLFYGTISL